MQEPSVPRNWLCRLRLKLTAFERLVFYWVCSLKKGLAAIFLFSGGWPAGAGHVHGDAQWQHTLACRSRAENSTSHVPYVRGCEETAVGAQLVWMASEVIPPQKCPSSYWGKTPVAIHAEHGSSTGFSSFVAKLLVHLCISYTTAG